MNTGSLRKELKELSVVSELKCWGKEEGSAETLKQAHTKWFQSLFLEHSEGNAEGWEFLDLKAGQADTQSLGLVVECKEKTLIGFKLPLVE